MWTMRKEQVDQMADRRAANYHAQLMKFYRQRVPQLAERFSDKELHLLIADTTKKARTLGIHSSEGILQFVGLALAAGPSFHEDPAVQVFFALPAGTMDEKVRRLVELVAGNLNRLSAGSLR